VFGRTSGAANHGLQLTCQKCIIWEAKEAPDRGIRVTGHSEQKKKISLVGERSKRFQSSRPVMNAIGQRGTLNATTGETNHEKNEHWPNGVKMGGTGKNAPKKKP